MKSKIIFSIFIVIVFLSGLGVGLYGGMAAGVVPSVGQLWAGAKEMQGAIYLIDKQESNKARELLCNSIKTRLIIMDMAKPLQTEASSRQVQELEAYTYGSVKKGKAELNALCIQAS
ncbi:hypothetical protein [Psychrobium sp. 1_MG-2023]|uniref:hypothetical protein n=1 Tax=Psychrobium sp. 1_MG-2023 TaxID=3062624 RepID=UPI000C347CAA|nr:hypothetical protein [Psychrobium sp. 1_MG-2023]MDP2560917.1 hypothetical protein [Psychrobium sp. 1_MG-2023]PKF55991.1 hypothetical protein CW748_11260 [Alteromonadales bacterium alter-6D02]